MTVLNNYADLNEVYGTNFSKKKKKIKKLKHPAYNYPRKLKNISNVEPSQSNEFINNNSSYQIGEDSNNKIGNSLKNHVDNHNEYHQYVDKEEELDYFDKLYKSYEFKPLEETDGSNLMKYEERENDEENEDDFNNRPEIKRKIKVDTLYNPNQHPYYLKDNNSNSREYSPDKHYIDFALFLISGILLIFILEQFVRLGTKLSSNNIQPPQQPIYYIQQPPPGYVPVQQPVQQPVPPPGTSPLQYGGGLYANTTNNYAQEYPNLRPTSVNSNNLFNNINE